MPNEREWLKNISAGDTTSFKIIFDCYHPHVYGLALRFTKIPAVAEDLTQDIFTRIWVNRAALAEVQDFRPYLNTVTKNLLRDFLKKKTIVTTPESAASYAFTDTSASPEAWLERKELQTTVHMAIQQLSPQLQRAFTLSRFNGFTHHQIAEQMNVSVNTSKSHLVRAIHFIRLYLREKGSY